MKKLTKDLIVGGVALASLIGTSVKNQLEKGALQEPQKIEQIDGRTIYESQNENYRIDIGWTGIGNIEIDTNKDGRYDLIADFWNSPRDKGYIQIYKNDSTDAAKSQTKWFSFGNQENILKKIPVGEYLSKFGYKEYSKEIFKEKGWDPKAINFLRLK